MAQRTIHYLFGEIISNEIELEDKERFLLGSIMPDAVREDDRDKSHFIVRTDRLAYFDFEAYRDKYFQQMCLDDLYLGYYMHLIVDAFYRVFIYRDCFTMPRAREEVKLLHNDYHILNSYIVKKYNIRNILEKNVVLGNEIIVELAAFGVDKLLEELSNDFVEQVEGNTVFLTENMVEEFVEIYIPLAIEEIRSIKNGKSILNVKDYVWKKKR